MTNSYYTATGNPAQLSRGTSATQRAEFALVQAGFALLPIPAAMYGGMQNFYDDSGSANSIVVALAGAAATYITSLTDGLSLAVEVAAANTGSTVLTITGVATNVPVLRPSGGQLQPNDLYAGQVATFSYSAAQSCFQYSGQSAAIAGGGGLPLSGGTLTGALNEAKGANIASAATVNLQTATGNFVHITGTTTITGFTLAAGAERTVIFDGSLTLTNSSTLLLPGAANIQTQAGDRAIIRGDTSSVYVVSYTRAAAAATPFSLNYIAGFTLSNDGTTPNSVLDIAAGFAADSANAVPITGTAFTKSTAGTWAAGSGSNGMGTGLTIANSTWYHVFAIINGGAYDVYFDTSLTAANAPASTTAHRYIGSFKTNSSAQITAFTQIGQRFFWNTAITDVSVASSTAGAHAVTLSVPLGLSTHPILNISISSSNDAAITLQIISGLTSVVDGVATGVGTVFTGTGQVTTTSSTSSQISYSAGNGNAVTINTTGYINPKVASNN